MLSYNLAHMVTCDPSIIYEYAIANNYVVVINAWREQWKGTDDRQITT